VNSLTYSELAFCRVDAENGCMTENNSVYFLPLFPTARVFTGRLCVSRICLPGICALKTQRTVIL